MLWDGNRQIQEYKGDLTFTTVYEQNSFEPVARIISDENELKVYHYHNDHLGTPNELTNDKGEVIWLADYEAWGNVSKICDDFHYKEQEISGIKVSSEDLQPIRFQGQFFDSETALHYNRFRYYDPDVGMFISRDPIGLMGGNNVFQYAPNPVMWIDPWGLQRKGNAKIVNNSVRVLKPSNNGKGPPRWHSLTSPKPKSSKHGDSHDCCAKAYGYILFDKDTGEVVKFGETIHKDTRYSKGDLREMNAVMKVVKTGTKKEMHTWQHLRILDFKAKHGRRPKYNFNDY